MMATFEAGWSKPAKTWSRAGGEFSQYPCFSRAKAPSGACWRLAKRHRWASAKRRIFGSPTRLMARVVITSQPWKWIGMFRG